MQRFKILLLLLWMALPAVAWTLSDGAVVSLLSCAPGQSLYERYGHTAIRIQDQDMDIVFNYGMFSFETEHFYWKFVKGETMYELGCQSGAGFMAAYQYEMREVEEQVLNLTQQQKQQLMDALCVNYEEANRAYLYNFVFDNCATRPYKLIQEIATDSITSDYTEWEGKSYREYISHYTGKGSWTDLGINLLFGPKADKELQKEDCVFLPEGLMHYIEHAQVGGHESLSNSPVHKWETPTIAWYETWYTGLAIIILLLAGLTWHDRQQKRITWSVDLSIGILYLLLLILVGFLTWFSIHPLVGFGWRLLIYPIIHLCIRAIYYIH